MLRISSKMALFFSVLAVFCISLSFYRVAFAQENVPDPPLEELSKLKTGRIDAITKDWVVIDDMASPLSGVKIYDQNGFLLDASSLTAGRCVAFNRDRMKTEIHLRDCESEEPQSQEEGFPEEAKGIQKENIRKVDGVWKN